MRYDVMSFIKTGKLFHFTTCTCYDVTLQYLIDDAFCVMRNFGYVNSIIIFSDDSYFIFERNCVGLPLLSKINYV
jgi:hypothetical protein